MFHSTRVTIGNVVLVVVVVVAGGGGGQQIGKITIKKKFHNERIGKGTQSEAL